MKRDTTDLKNFNIRMPKELFMFLKKTSAITEATMTDIVIRALERYKIIYEDGLTSTDTNV